MANYQALFSEADTDNNGHLDIKELEIILRKHGYKLSSAELKRMFKGVDTSGDNLISFDEYMAAMTKQPAPVHKKAIMRKAFECFDADGNGEIDKKELHNVFKELKRNLTEAEVQRLMELCDKDGSGTMNYVEFAEQVFGEKA